MYAIYGNIYHQYTPNVSIYTIHGSYGLCNIGILRKNISEPNGESLVFTNEKLVPRDRRSWLSPMWCSVPLIYGLNPTLQYISTIYYDLINL